VKTPRSSFQFLLISISIVAFPAYAEELLSFNNITASVTRDYECRSGASVRLDTKDEKAYRESRIDMQKLSEIVKTYLWLDCKELDSVNFEGFVEGKESKVYSARVEKKSAWFLHETDGTVEERQNASTPIKEQPIEELIKENLDPEKKINSLESLEAAAENSSDAKLNLAKGLLDLPDKLEGIEFPDDAERGIAILEKIAAEGNPDAMQLLSRAYSSDNTFELNIPLIEALTGRPMVESEEQRGMASASLTLKAAANGSELAVNDLQEAGLAGSDMSYYALGMMYLLDQALKMPYEPAFLEQQLDMESDASGAGGNVDVGLHFLTLAAESGNAEAQELLGDMDVEFEVSALSGSTAPTPALSLPGTSTTQAQDQANSGAQTNERQHTEPSDQESNEQTNSLVMNAPSNGTSSSTSPPSNNSSRNNSVYAETLIEAGVLDDILETRNEGEGTATNTSHPSQIGNHNPSGNKEELTSESSGLGNSGRENTSTRDILAKSTESQPRGHTDYGKMNTKQSEAEIID